MGATLTQIITFSEFPFSNRLRRCRRSLPLTYSDIVLRLTNNLLHEAKDRSKCRRGLLSPCQANLDGRIRLRINITPETELVESVPDLWDISDTPIRTDDVSKTNPKPAKRSGSVERLEIAAPI